MRNLTQALTLTSMTTAVRSAFKIASVNPVLWWDAESHRAGLAGGVPTLFQDSGGTSAVTAVEQPVGRAVGRSGNARHALQATSTARPILTARKNHLLSSKFESAAWSGSGASIDDLDEIMAGGITLRAVKATAGVARHFVQRYSDPGTLVVASGQSYTITVLAKAGTANYLWFGDSQDGPWHLASVNLETGAVARVDGATCTAMPLGNGLYRCSLTYVRSNAAGSVTCIAGPGVSASVAGMPSYLSNGTEKIYCSYAQIELGSTATSYQRVAAANDYDTTAAPLMMRFDGVDDSLASSAIATATLPSSADAWLVFTPAADEQDAVFVDDPSSAGVRYFGTRAPGQSASQRQDGATTANASFTLNGALIAGTVDPTRQQLYSATSGGAPVLLQVTNLNLSSWLGVRLGAYAGNGSGYGFKGRHGALLITPAQSDATRAKIRKALAKAYQIQGVV